MYNIRNGERPGKVSLQILKGNQNMITPNNNIMIIDFNVNFNTYEEKILNNYGFFSYLCPKCGANHSFSRHGTYERNISFFSRDNICNDKIKILRLKCASCESTHAILPVDVIPYCIYSYSIMMKIVTDFFVDEKRMLDLANKYNISFQLIYSFISKLNRFSKDCIYVLRILSLLGNIFNPTIKDILVKINDYSFNNSFQKIFLCETNWMFLMNKFLNMRSKLIFIGSSIP